MDEQNKNPDRIFVCKLPEPKIQGYLYYVDKEGVWRVPQNNKAGQLSKSREHSREALRRALF